MIDRRESNDHKIDEFKHLFSQDSKKFMQISHFKEDTAEYGSKAQQLKLLYSNIVKNHSYEGCAEFIDKWQKMSLEVSQEHYSLNCYFNSSEEHFSTLTINYRTETGVNAIHLVDTIWFENKQTSIVQENKPLINIYNHSELKEGFKSIIKLCNLKYDDIKHIHIHYGKQVINALVSDTISGKGIEDEYTEKLWAKNAIKITATNHLLPVYKNYGRTEVVFKHYTNTQKLILTGHFYNSGIKKNEAITLVFSEVKELIYNPLHTVGKEYGDDIIYLRNQNGVKTFTCFSALRDPIEIVAQEVELLN